jgi:hypothetical protein
MRVMDDINYYQGDDLRTKRYGLWTVIGFHELRGKHAYWDCVCECGTKSVVAGTNLKTGRSKGCGCAIGRAPKNTT